MEVSAAMPAIDEKIYGCLVAETLPHVIHTEEENEQYLAELERLHGGSRLTPEEG
jgi:hypothetical protein